MNLPYLAAVINETLRIHHPTSINLPRVVPPEGPIIDGRWIPGGVRTPLSRIKLLATSTEGT